MIAMLLAAGRGERLRPLTDALPKALVDIDGVSLLERHLAALKSAGFTNVVVNLGWLGEQIVERVGSGARYGLTVAYSPEGDSVLETGGGIHRALPLLGEAPFLVVNADVYTDMPYPKTLSSGRDGHLVLVPTPAFKPQGDFDVVDGKLATAASPKYTFSGVAIYHPRFFAACAPGRFPLAPLLRTAADQGRLAASVYNGVWEDVGTAERLQTLRRRLA